ncbi:DUF1614 domain-containing protein [Candidatus Bathyarchaeota archaeon]|nr:DUF1614 domain-containing protein [Candidatus Bathyarchaeota archaeon]
MSRKIIFWSFSRVLLLALFLILVLVSSLLFIGAIGLAFKRVGFSSQLTVLILAATFVGSYLNIPLFKIKTIFPIIKNEYFSFFGLIFRVPQIEYEDFSTIIALNVGGALIPTIVSVYLLWSLPSTVPYALTGTLIVALVTHLVARPVMGLGIVTPAFVPPLASALMAYFLPSSTPAIIAYTSGVFGTLIGADILNLSKIPKIGARIASIGGAGTFDGIFLSGIISVLLV